MAQLNITLNQEEILQLLSKDRARAFPGITSEQPQHISDLQVVVRDRTRHIYDERHGEPGFHIPASEQSARFISRRPVVAQGAVHRRNGGREETASSDTRPGQNIRRTVDNVRWEAA